MATMRSILDTIADQYKGLAALAGAALFGATVALAGAGFFTLPPQNAEAVAELRAEGDARDDRISAIETAFQVQAVLWCALATRMEGADLPACQNVQGVLLLDRSRVPPGDGDDS